MLTSDLRVVVSWTEVTRENDRLTHLFYSHTYPAGDLENARQLYARALQANGWAPDIAHDVAVDLVGRDVPFTQRQTPEQFRAGMAMVREALGNAHGPLAKDLSSSIGQRVDRKRMAAGEREVLAS